MNNLINKISVGANFTMFIKNEMIFGSGENSSGQLGLGHWNNVFKYNVATGIDNVKEIHSGLSHTFALKNDGTLWCCGNNTYGQLGLGNFINQNRFVEVKGIKNPQKISCGAFHTVVETEIGEIFVTGFNEIGQLGLGHNNDVNIFTKLNNFEYPNKIECGGYFTFIENNYGELFSTGGNTFGQLGLGHNKEVNIFTKLEDFKYIKKISCGEKHVIIEDAEGDIYTCGDNFNKELGTGKDNKNINKFTIINGFSNPDYIFAGYNNSFIVDEVGRTYVCGNSLNYQLATGEKTKLTNFKLSKIKEPKNIKSSIDFVLYQDFNEDLFFIGSNESHQCGINSYVAEKDITQIII